MTDPFRITGPAVVNFSGGRTSALLMRRVLDAHGGVLPDDIVVIFCNTGRELPATLDFVRDCAAAWGVHVNWLEFTARAPTGYRVVNHNSASRNGEPFAALLKSKSMLPNPVMRFCTSELKIATAERFLRGTLGWQQWTDVVGLRADEPGRVVKAVANGRLCPLAEAGIQEFHVLDFWRAQPFNLRLRGRHEGNCDGCFLKGRGALSRMFSDHPERMAWWVQQERDLRHGAGMGATFRTDREDYASIARTTRDQGVLAFDLEDSLPCTEAVCGV